MKDPICFGCKHFKQYQPLTFNTPGACKWEPKEPVPDWLEFWLGSDDQYYGPDRDVRTRSHIRTECPAFESLQEIAE